MKQVVQISGRYFEYECESIEEDQAKDIIENGISVWDFEDFDFDSASDSGLIEGEVLLDGSVVKQLPEVAASDQASSVLDGWAIVREITGKATLRIEIDQPFQPDLVSTSVYFEKVGEYQLTPYFYATYNEEDFEDEFKDAKYEGVFIVSPTGEVSDFEILDE